MNSLWIIFTLITVAYIIILVLYFLRRSKTHEKELKNFLDLAQQELDKHKTIASEEANLKVTKAIAVVKKVQQAAQTFEEQAQKEYNDIIEDAKAERREILAKTKAEVEELFKKADVELEQYSAARHQEIERNLVKLVVAVSEKVVEVSLTPKEHEEIIYKSLEEIKQQRAKG